MRENIHDKPTGVTYTVLLDGKDISNRCYAFDTLEGWADCYELEESGQLKIEETGSSHGWKDYDLVRSRLFGDVSAVKHPENIEAYDRLAHSSWTAAFYRAKAYFKRVGAKK